MYEFFYQTRITKDKLSVMIGGWSIEEAFQKFVKLIPEAIEVTYCHKVL